MKKLTISDDRKKEIIAEIRRSDDSRYDHRLHGLLLVANGMSPYRVSELLGNSPKSIENWVNVYIEEGLDALRETKRSGRPPRLSNLMDSIDSDLRKNPRDLGYSQNLWDGKLLSHHLREKYDIDLGTRQCQRIFRKLRFRLRKPSPVIAKSDPEKQDEFKNS
ncbi:MAG: winged helix-turn-helix domain-containing protein [Thermoplasmataceae archaeon]